MTIKEVKFKELPAEDDSFAVDAGFDDMNELRQDLSSKIEQADEERVEAEFRQAALDAAVAAATVDVTPELVAARAGEMWERMLHTLSHRGISREAYLGIIGREEQDIVSEMEPEADIALRREAVITAIVEAEGISPSEEEILAALAPTAEREGTAAEELLGQLRSAGRLDEVREDLAARQAIDLIAEAAKPIAMAQAQAREQIWTPEKAQAQPEQSPSEGGEASRLWTPDR